MTSVQQPLTEMAAAATRMVLTLAAQPRASAQHPGGNWRPRWVVRGSTAVAPQHWDRAGRHDAVTGVVISL